jgi:hypothetical protein
VHPDVAAERAVTPSSSSNNVVSHAAPPPGSAGNGVERSPETEKAAANGQPGIHHHGTCTVNHRSAEAAAKCRRTS